MDLRGLMLLFRCRVLGIGFGVWSFGLGFRVDDLRVRGRSCRLVEV